MARKVGASEMSRLIIPTVVIAAVLTAAPAHAESCSIDGPPCAHAEDYMPRQGEPLINHWKRWQVLPPAQYDHPYAGQLQIFEIENEQMPYICPKTLWPITLACSRRFADGWCHITLAPDAIAKSGWPYEVVLRHEIGHCNGWSGDHKGQRPLNKNEMLQVLRGEKIESMADLSAVRERPASEVVKDITVPPADVPPPRTVQPGIHEIDEGTHCYVGTKEVPCSSVHDSRADLERERWAKRDAEAEQRYRDLSAISHRTRGFSAAGSSAAAPLLHAETDRTWLTASQSMRRE